MSKSLFCGEQERQDSPGDSPHVYDILPTLLRIHARSYHHLLADFDAGGALDALIAGQAQAVLWRNVGRGAFERTSQRFRFNERYGLAVADFNRDGSPDLFAASYHWSYRLWLNRGNGAFRLAQVR